ncbi:uncharacterized protein EDB91DRAFT_858807 [Suillus paluster]|uniref:uncharacterized protein n=1 Tax=Suillus paluster TaxID=48578 RepID=UPI001B863D99|nr:uncharacterized protein EDB91DRAFT_858807 [Suillus paluster]KAG1728376.1 hypothetical protein EDB91DRAFT_858807 [Suillus paluster]
MRIVDKFVEAWHDASDTVDNQIFAIPLGELRGITLDISTYATPGKFRLIHCGRFLNEQVLAIHEISSLDIPSYSYAAISYPWEGLPRNNNNTYNTFTVEGTGKIEREKGPKKYKPVSIDVLTHACKAATSDGDNLKNKSAKGCRYIWLDKLCMLQEDHDDEAPDVRTPEKKDRDEKAKKDKDWQIMHMWDIYSKCRMCIILPGGMGRLARVEEDTTWIQRSWTFQEAIAQLENAFVLFRWIHGKVDIYGKDGANFHYSEVSPGESAMCTLDIALQCNCLGKDGTLPILTEQGGHQILINLVGRTNDPHVTAFLAVTDARHAVTEARDTVEEKQRDLTETQRIITTKAGFAPEKVAHDVSEARFAVTQARRSLSEVEDAYRQGIWRCSLMRSSSRPVDTCVQHHGRVRSNAQPQGLQDSRTNGKVQPLPLRKGYYRKDNARVGSLHSSLFPQ